MLQSLRGRTTINGYLSHCPDIFTSSRRPRPRGTENTTGLWNLTLFGPVPSWHLPEGTSTCALCERDVFFFYILSVASQPKKKKNQDTGRCFHSYDVMFRQRHRFKTQQLFFPSVLLWLCSTKQDLFITSVQLLRYHCLQRSQVEVKVKMNEEPVNTHTNLNEPHVNHA